LSSRPYLQVHIHQIQGIAYSHTYKAQNVVLEWVSTNDGTANHRRPLRRPTVSSVLHGIAPLNAHVSFWMFEHQLVISFERLFELPRRLTCIPWRRGISTGMTRSGIEVTYFGEGDYSVPLRPQTRLRAVCPALQGDPLQIHPFGIELIFWCPTTSLSPCP